MKLEFEEKDGELIAMWDLGDLDKDILENLIGEAIKYVLLKHLSGLEDDEIASRVLGE